MPRLNFEYEDPTPNFDRRKVKGVAVQLISLSQEHFNKATALEIAGGGKLYNVVIEDEKVGKDLIKNGRMRKRWTFIPLTKISAWTLAPAVSYAQLLEEKAVANSTTRNSKRPSNSLQAKFGLHSHS